MVRAGESWMHVFVWRAFPIEAKKVPKAHDCLLFLIMLL